MTGFEPSENPVDKVGGVVKRHRLFCEPGAESRDAADGSPTFPVDKAKLRPSPDSIPSLTKARFLRNLAVSEEEIDICQKPMLSHCFAGLIS